MSEIKKRNIIEEWEFLKHFEAAAIRQRIEKAKIVEQVPLEITEGTCSDWAAAIEKLAELQVQSRTRSANLNTISRRAARVLLPLLKNKEDVAMVLLLAAPKSGFEYIFEARQRRPSEMPATVVKRLRSRQPNHKDEVIGLAVVQEYKRLGKGKLEEAIANVSKLGAIDGINTGGEDNVRARWKAYKKLAKDRGFADLRAVTFPAYLGSPGPEDLITFDDFPPPDGRG